MDDVAIITNNIVHNFTDLDWFLTSYKRIDGETKSILENSSYSFNINATSARTTGIFDCNAYSTTYSLEDEILRFGSRESDGAVCDHQNDPRYNEQSGDVSYLFSRDIYVTFNSDGLIAKTSQEDQYFFETNIGNDSSIEGITWNLVQYYSGSGDPLSIIEGTQYQFMLDSESLRASGIFECTTFTSDYSITNMSVNFGRLQLDGQDCTIDTAGYLEQNEFISLMLSRGLDISLENRNLKLTDSTGNYLLFTNGV